MLLFYDDGEAEERDLLLDDYFKNKIENDKKQDRLTKRKIRNDNYTIQLKVQKHSTTILSAMMAGLDDRDDLNDDITLESMIGLTKIIALIDENNVRPILINILLRIRPCFEKVY